MTRVRTHKAQYAIISNNTAQDNNLSFEALGFLTYCLSMPENWDFYPQVIWKQRTGLSRNKAYALFNELIETYHCIRIRAPNLKAKGLPGEVSYEMFDDPEMCKNRILELENTGVFLEHGGNFKLCFRRSNSQYAEDKHADSQHLLKKQDIKEIHYKETLLHPTEPLEAEFGSSHVVSCVLKSTIDLEPDVPDGPDSKSSLRSSDLGASPSEEDFQIYKSLENTNLSPGQKRQLTRNFSEPDIVRALKMAEGQPIKKSFMALLMHILNNPADWQEPSKQEQLTREQQSALKFNAELAKVEKLKADAEKNIKLIKEKNCVVFPDGKGGWHSQTKLDSDFFEADLTAAYKALDIIKNKYNK